MNEHEEWRTPPPLPPEGLTKPGEPLMERDWFFYIILITAIIGFFALGEILFGWF